ncbi:hypothetical protein D9M68_960130 [compost metagenome]
MRVLTGLPSQKPVRYFTSTPYAEVSWLTTSSSLTPASNNFRASVSTSPIGRLTRSPRMEGMMQKVQRWLQPSLIFR